MKQVVFSILVFSLVFLNAKAAELTCKHEVKADSGSSCSKSKSAQDKATELAKLSAKCNSQLTDEQVEALYLLQEKGLLSLGYNSAQGYTKKDLPKLKKYKAQYEEKIETLQKYLEDPEQGKINAKNDYEKIKDEVTDLQNQLASAEPEKKAELNTKMQELYSKYQFQSQVYSLMNYGSSYAQQHLVQYQTKVTEFGDQIKKLEKEDETTEVTKDKKRKEIEDNLKSAVKFFQARPGYKDCGFSDLEFFAIIYYSGNGYTTLNQILRNKPPLSEDQKKYKVIIDALNSALDKIGNFQGQVRRGATMPAEVLKEHCVGCVVTYPAFTSTSTGGGFPGQHHFIIKSKTGHYIDPISSASGEQEVLFKSGTKFKVLSVKGSEYVLEEVIK